MRQHFPEIIGLTFAGSVVLIFVFAAIGGTPGLVLGGTGVAAAVLALRNRALRRRA